MKKQWISVKCGLSRDPKHRQTMGEGIWLFLHILDIASWDDGIAHDWKDDAAAEDMGMPVRTLREHRRKLDELGYITCVQKQYTQDIIVHNWTNPREYGGQVYNEKQGDSETTPSDNSQGYIQGDTQGYIQGSTKHVTPTSYSKNQITKPDMVDMLIEQAKQAQQREEAYIAFEGAFGFGKLGWDDKPEWKRLAKFVRDIYAKDKTAFIRYVEWRKSEGKYQAMTNNKIRQYPDMFIDTGWPTFEAHSAMNKQADDRSSILRTL